jgi:hypothetical protein
MNDTTYYYVVTAVDGNSNESAYSSEVSATPMAGIVPAYNYDFGSGAGQDTIASAGLTTYIQSGSANSVTDEADGIGLNNLVESGSDSAAGFYRAFTGLGPGLTDDFVITMTFTLPVEVFSEPDIGIHLFGDTSSSAYWNTGIYAYADKDRHNHPQSRIGIRQGGLTGSILQSGTIAKDVDTAGFTTTIKVAGTYGTYGTDNLQLVLTVSADGATNTVTATVDTTGYSATQTGFGVSMLSDNNNQFLVDTFTVASGSGAPPYSYGQWASGWSTNIGVAANDFDLDGLDNLYEYGLDGDPTNALDQGTLPTLIKSGDTFIYVHPQRADDESLVYTVETTTNLVSGVWTNEGYTVTGTNVTGGTLDFMTNDVDTVEDEKFIRLKIEK